MEERHATVHMLPQAAYADLAVVQHAPMPEHPGLPEHAELPELPGRIDEPPAPVRVHILGADALARVGLRTLLEGHPGIRLTGESAPGAQALATLRALRPHVVVVHGALPDGEHSLLEGQLAGSIKILTVGGATDGTPDAGHGHRAAAPAGVHGHLPGTASAGQLASAVVLAAAGYVLVRPPTPPPGTGTGAGTGAGRRVARVSPDELTERECEVLELLAHGLSNGEIADSLTLSEHTVKTHVQNLLHKLRLRNRVHAAIYAFETGLRRPC